MSSASHDFHFHLILEMFQKTRYVFLATWSIIIVFEYEKLIHMNNEKICINFTFYNLFLKTRDDLLAVNWDYYDDESGIDRFEVAIFEMRFGSKIKIFPDGKFMSFW